MRLILGSASPRRKELLAQIGVVPDAIIPPKVDETPGKGELPRAYCARISGAKAQAVAADDNDVVLCADTIVAMGRRILGKPADESEAAAYLWALSGRRHRVITSVTVKCRGRAWSRDSISVVKMKSLSNIEVNAYLASGEWQGKAGGYGIQGMASTFIPWIRGSFTGIVGLPLAETAQLLQAAGYDVWGQND